ncbi:hypothetical protein FAZ69_08385 [Trinickia terrae]|uniref:Uncharacterized protein n=1 Tax=Trinickia terrae TaxID=2571161 RepID=A0A4U1I9J2_9BURK|nr:hypothetical protein [Trinickia terrae]TKC90156.1 hypothetical protein FAZ69_08385 [Trinickia terrae]
MSGTIDQNPFAFEQDLDALEGQLGEAADTGGQGPAKAPGKAPPKPFPLKLFAIGFGTFIVLLGGAFVLTLKRASPAQEQMQAIPQPQMAAPAAQAVPPLPPGVPPGAQGMQQSWAPAQPPMAPPQNAQSPQGQPGVFPAAPPAADPSAAVQQGQAVAPGANVQPMIVAPGQQPIQAQPAAVQPTPAQPAEAQSMAAQPAPAAAVHRKRGAAWSDAAGGQPIGPEPTAAPKLAAAMSDGSQQQIAELRRQVAELTNRLNQMSAGNGNGAQAQAEASGDAAAPAPAKPEKRRAHEAHKAKGAKAAKTGAAANDQDSGYVLTGMIDNRAFVARKGSGDVNASLTLAPGDKLDDGRKVIQVDAKNRRVWLSGGKYIGLPPDSAPSNSDNQPSSSDQ